ncbi:hypothetical protein [Paenibacillus chitinolyticus]|uniref:hypothetical protein n=1 Tax=Paenibacillus chitinolyticus TaxID=79263 RepID=UPI00295ECEDA|nr:hypothetical protein [Paenibacillus chitinolyticus]
MNRKHLAAAAQEVSAWLLSATLLRKYPGWIDQYMTKNRTVRWDPGTFSDDPISYATYRNYLHQHMKSHHTYLQYDEIGDPEATAYYLKDMRRRGMQPIPVLQGNAFHLLRQEPHLAIGGLVRMSDEERRRYLDEVFYDHKPIGKIHLLGMIQHKWFSPYMAHEGDNTSWIPRSEWNRRKSVDEWLKEYGGQWVPHYPRELVQTQLFS